MKGWWELPRPAPGATSTGFLESLEPWQQEELLVAYAIGKRKVSVSSRILICYLPRSAEIAVSAGGEALITGQLRAVPGTWRFEHVGDGNAYMSSFPFVVGSSANLKPANICLDGLCCFFHNFHNCP